MIFYRTLMKSTLKNGIFVESFSARAIIALRLDGNSIG